MIGYLKGTISHLFAEYCFLDVQGVGYRVFIPFSTREKLGVGLQASLHTYLNVREDALTLFGFYTPKEYEMFLHLISVTGIGPKVAMNILSNVKPDEFYFYISQKRLDFLTQIPGIGKKTAERIILELKDKISIEVSENTIGENDFHKNIMHDADASSASAGKDAVLALVALGYNQNEAAAAVRKIADKNKDGDQEYSAQQLIKMALRDLGAR